MKQLYECNKQATDSCVYVGKGSVLGGFSVTATQALGEKWPTMVTYKRKSLICKCKISYEKAKRIAFPDS